MKRLNLVGKKFGRLEVIKFAYTENKRSHWLCKCKCGNEVVVKRKLLINNHTKSCGCLRKEISALINKDKHLLEETKRKISEAKKGQISWNKGLTFETDSRILAGKNNGNYKHGLSQTPEYTAARESKHRATKRNQTPINADPIKIQKIYSYCAKLNEVGFFRYEVDHIKPLSKSGLHHQDNLQILLAMLNHEKSDKWPLTKLERLKYKGITLKDLF